MLCLFVLLIGRLTILKNKGFFVLFIAYVVLFLGDLGTTLSLSRYLDFFELNPLYALTGSLWPIVLLNVGLIVLLWWYYHREKTMAFSRFLVVQMMLTVILLRVLAIRNAIYWMKNPVTVEVAAQIGTEAVRQAAFTQVAIMAWSPFVICFLTYIFWRCDHFVNRGDIV